MMARKNAIKSENPGSIYFDPSTNSVMAETSHLQDNVKEKVSAVREVMPGRSNNEIILVLQYYDYNVEKAIQAYVEDGAKQALTEWHYPGNTAPKKKRNKKKKPARDNTAQINGDVSNTPSVPNGIVPNGTVESDSEPTKASSQSDISSSVSSLSPTTCTIPSLSSSDINQSNNATQPTSTNRNKSQSPTASVSNDLVSTSQSSTLNVKPKSERSDGKTSITTSPSTENTRPNGTTHQPVDKLSQPLTHGSAGSHKQHAHTKQGHHSASHSHRQRTISEKSTDSHPGPKQIHKSLEKSVKDLHRQTVSLERLRSVLHEEVDKNYKRIKTVFDEMRDCLNNREVEVIREMDAVKAVANETFLMRQKNALDLKLNVDRAERMDEKQLAQLRADIKHFVSDRKIDEDLSRTTRFLYDSDHLRHEIAQFGEVVPVKCTYSQRRPSISSVASSDDHPVVETNNSKPVSQSEVEAAHPHGLDPKETAEVAELQQRLKDSLHLQGYDKSSGPRGQRNQENKQNQHKPDQRQSNGPRPQYSGGPRPQSSRGPRPQQSDDIRGFQSGGPRPQSSGGPRPQSDRGFGSRGRGRGGFRGRGRGQGQGRPRSPRKDFSQEGRGNNSGVNSSP